MKKTISLIMTIFMIALSVFVMPMSAQAAETNTETENEKYRREFLSAMQSNESAWAPKKNVTYSQFYFMDLDFDGKDELVVWYYGGTSSLHYSDIYTYSDTGRIVKVVDSEKIDYANLNPKYLVNTASFKYYYNKDEKRFFIHGTYVVRNGVWARIVKSYVITFDVKKSRYLDGYNMEFYQSYHYSKDASTGQETYTYYRDSANGTEQQVSEAQYNADYERKFKNCVDVNMVKKEILYSNYKSMTASKKKTALEESYDSFYYDWLIMRHDTNQFSNFPTTGNISEKRYRDYLYKDSYLTLYNTFVLQNTLNKGELGGVCHGIALTICYAKTGQLDLKKLNNNTDVNCYWKLGRASGNQKFKDLLIYYDLTQQTYRGNATHYTLKSGWDFDMQTLPEFLESLKNEAQKAQMEHKPFVLGFNYNNKDGNTEGHSVVVCGYRYNSETQKHEIVTYDVNAYDEYNPNDNPYEKYYIFSVSKDYSSFEYKDVNHELNNKDLKSDWTGLKFWGLDQVYGDSSLHSIHRVNETKPVSAADTADIYVSYGKRFRLTNAEGKYLEYDGSQYTGNMTVYDCAMVNDIAGNFSWRITADKSSGYKFLPKDNDCALFAETSSGQIYVSANNADSIEINSDSITVKGTSIAFDTAFHRVGDWDMIRIQGQASGTTVFKNSRTSIDVHCDGAVKNAEATSFKGDTVRNEKIPGTPDSFKVIASNGEVIIGSAEAFTAGDVNNDGAVKNRDALILDRYIAGWKNYDQQIKNWDAADLNRDGMVKNRDALILDRYIAGWTIYIKYIVVVTG